MTTQPEHAPGEGRSAVQFIRPLRDAAVLVLVAAPAVLLFVAVLRLIPADIGEDFETRARDSFYSFVNLATIGLPLLAVLLATLVKPQHPQHPLPPQHPSHPQQPASGQARTKLVVVIALIEYAVAGIFAVLFGILIGLISIAGFSVRAAFEELLVRGAWLAVFGIAAFAVLQIWRNMFYVPRPAAQPGMYGQPLHPGQHFGPQGQAYGQPPHPGQQFGPPGQPYGAPGQQPYGYPQSGGPQPAPGQWGQPAPGQWGQPAPTSGQPATPQGPFAPAPGHPPAAAPQSAPPAAGPYGPAPGYAPGSRPEAPGAGPSAPAEPIRVEPAPEREERTEVLGSDRPSSAATNDDDQSRR